MNSHILNLIALQKFVANRSISSDDNLFEKFRNFYFLFGFILILFAPNLFIKVLSAQALPGSPSPIQGNSVAQPSPTNYQLNMLQNSAYSSLTQSFAPETYIVGPGDVLFISIFSQTYSSFQVAITPEGKLILPRLAEIVVKRLTIPEVRDSVHRTLLKTYRKAEISVSLVTMRTFEIDVLGEVSLPSKIRVSAADRVSDAITRSPALLDKASLRQVKLRRSNPDTIHKLDIFRFYRLTDNRDNMYLREGDVLLVERRVEDVISVLGDVKYPDRYEFVPGDSLFTLLRLAGGVLESTANLDSVEIIRFNSDRRTTRSLFVSIRGWNIEQNLPLERNDIVIVRRLPLLFPEQTIEIKGYAFVPGTYRIEKGKTTLKEALQLAGGIRPDGSLEEASLYRPKVMRGDVEISSLGEKADLENEEVQYLAARKREPKGKMTVNFKKLFQDNDTTQNILIEPGDIIEIPYYKPYVNVIGRVLYPGNIPFHSGKTIDDYIKAAGGYGKRALKDEVLVLKPNTGDLLEGDAVGEIEPSDIILVQEKMKSTFWKDFVTIFFQISGIIGAIATTYFVIQNVR
ncbi:MAG: SLBB domain-containing protein [Chloroherpetonaceae bacterium]|nr:SLBB domain-containing protein [Chloroherpetonaceae bacterium]